MSEASKIIQAKVDKEFNRQVGGLAKEITDKIIKQRDHFRGYDSSEYLLKCDFEDIFNEHSTVSQYGSPPTVKLKALIEALIIREVEESGKEKIAKNLVAKIEQFFEEGDTESLRNIN
jgi:hypothetical protein